jgi:hypothetical protein
MDAALLRRIEALSPAQRDFLLARLTSASCPAADGPLPIAIEPATGDRYEPFALTEMQRAYWVGRRGHFELGATATNVFSEYEIGLGTGDLPERLNAALRRLIEHHAMLRGVILDDGQQCVAPTTNTFEVTCLDLRDHDPTARGATLSEYRERLSFGGASIERWPLFDVALFRLGSDEYRLMLRLDALIADGYSRTLLVEQLCRCLLDREAALPESSWSYRDIVASTERAASAARNSPGRRRSKPLAPAPVIAEAGVRLSSTRARFEVIREPVLDSSGWRDLQHRAATHAVTASAVALAAFSETLASFLTAPRFRLAVIGSLRACLPADVQRVFGNLTTSYALSVDDVGQPFLQRVQATHRALCEKLDAPLTSALSELRAHRGEHGLDTSAPFPIAYNDVVAYPERRPEDRLRAAGLSGTGLWLRELSSVLCLPQLAVLISVLVDPEGGLQCVCQTVDTLPQDWGARLVEAYRQRLCHLMTDSNDWTSAWPVAVSNPAKASTTGREGEEPREARERTDAHAVTLVEPVVRSAWSSVLGSVDFGADDDFFALGGCSMVAVRLLEQLRQTYAVRLPMAQLFARPATVRSMADRIAGFVTSTSGKEILDGLGRQ